MGTSTVGEAANGTNKSFHVGVLNGNQKRFFTGGPALREPMNDRGKKEKKPSQAGHILRKENAGPSPSPGDLGFYQRNSQAQGGRQQDKTSPNAIGRGVQ